MAMTLAQYESLILAMLDEQRGVDNALFTNTDIAAECNAAQTQIVRATNHDFFKSYSNVDATAAPIAVPADFLGNADAFLVVNSTQSGRRPLTFKTRQVMDETNPNWRGQTISGGSYPQYAVLDWDAGTLSIQLYPILTATITLGFYMTYLKKPTDMTLTTDTSPIFTYFPEFERRLIPRRVVANILQFEAGEMDDRVQRLESMIQNDLNDFRSALNSMANFSSTLTNYGSYSIAG